VSSESVFSGDAARSVYSPGHNSFFASPDGKERWIAYHAYTVPYPFPEGSGRSLFIQPFTLDGNEKPVFGSPVSPDIKLNLPSGE
jgi:GH43 family beta-xylosidase